MMHINVDKHTMMRCTTIFECVISVNYVSVNRIHSHVNPDRHWWFTFLLFFYPEDVFFSLIFFFFCWILETTSDLFSYEPCLSWSLSWYIFGYCSIHHSTHSRILSILWKNNKNMAITTYKNYTEWAKEQVANFVAWTIRNKLIFGFCMRRRRKDAEIL